MGWSAGEEKEIYSLDELIEKFSLSVTLLFLQCDL